MANPTPILAEPLPLATAEKASRGAYHLQASDKLCDISRRLEDLLGMALDEETLAELRIRRGGDLDVDEAATCDFGPTFFAPVPRGRLPGAREKLAAGCSHASYMGWREYDRCLTGEPSRHGDEEHRCSVPAGIQAAEGRLEWTEHAWHYLRIHARVWLDNPWKAVPFEERHWRPEAEQLFHKDNRLPFDECHLFRTGEVRLDGSSQTPHTTALVACTTMASGPEVLRGEMMAAVACIKSQIHTQAHKDEHHTIPVLVFSAQRDAVMRITQVHFDGRGLLIRQSRPLDLQADEPTEDAWLAIRWLVGQPIGETTWSAPAACEAGGEAAQAAEHQPDKAVAVLA